MPAQILLLKMQKLSAKQIWHCTKCCRFIRIPACISEHISCCDFRSLALQLKDNCKKNTSFMILCCNTNLSYLVPLVHGLQSCCCQNKFDFFVFFTCKGSKIWRACKNHLNHHLDHHSHGWQHFWGFFLQVRHFVVFKNFIVMMMVLASQTMQVVVLRQKENDFVPLLLADGIIGCSSATIFIENNHLGGSKYEIMEVQRRRFMCIWLKE